MSFDVYLYERVTCPKCECRIDTNRRLYSSNITHNLDTRKQLEESRGETEPA